MLAVFSASLVVLRSCPCACCRRELLATLEQLEADKAVRGVIWASGLKRDVFTAGNDLKVPFVQGLGFSRMNCGCSPARPGRPVLQRTCGKRSACASNSSACLQELHAPSTSRARHADFWVTQTTFLARLRRSPLITVAAIRGACPAGGCCMALW